MKSYKYKIKIVNGVPTIKLPEGTFIVDTGCPYTMYGKTGDVKIAGVTHSFNANYTEILSFISKNMKIQCDGLIGMDIMSMYDMEFNYPADYIKFTELANIPKYEDPAIDDPVPSWWSDDLDDYGDDDLPPPSDDDLPPDFPDPFVEGSYEHYLYYVRHRDPRYDEMDIDNYLEFLSYVRLGSGGRTDVDDPDYGLDFEPGSYENYIYGLVHRDVSDKYDNYEEFCSLMHLYGFEPLPYDKKKYPIDPMEPISKIDKSRLYHESKAQNILDLYYKNHPELERPDLSDQEGKDEPRKSIIAPIKPNTDTQDKSDPTPVYKRHAADKSEEYAFSRTYTPIRKETTVEIKINGKTAKLLVDSGAYLSYIKYDKFVDFALDPIDQVEDFSIISRSTYKTDRYKLEGEYKGKKFDIFTGEAPDQVERVIFAHSKDGLIGYDFLKENVYKF